VSEHYQDEAKQLMEELKVRFEGVHRDEINTLSVVTLPKHVEENSMAALYLKHRYRIPLNQFVYGTLVHFLEKDREIGGDVILDILNERCSLEAMQRGPIEPFSFEAIYRRARNLELDDLDAQEGIPGIANSAGLSNRDILDNKAALKLGPLPMDTDLRADVLAELDDEDKANPPHDGASSLVEEFNLMHPIKKEAGDSPPQTNIPYPPSRARDVVVEMQKVRENRDRFRIDGRTGGVGPGISVCMFTIHNSLGR
jgi:transcription initiation factor TFIID subunit 5